MNELGNDTAEQTNIIINHLALVTNPRAGDICSIKDEQTINTKKEQDKKMTDNTDTFILGLKRFFKIVDAVNEKADKELEDEVGGDIDLGIGVQDADVAHESNEIKVETDIITMLNGIIKRLEALEEADKKELTDVCMEDDSTEDVVTDENTISETENTIGDALNTIISKAEILVPGFNKQFKGSSKETINTNTIKRQALKQAFLTDSVLLQPLVDGSIDEISDESLKVVFNAAVVLKTNKNNSLIKPTVILDSPRTPNAVEQHKAYFEQHNPK